MITTQRNIANMPVFVKKKALFLSGCTADKFTDTGLIADGMEIVMKPTSPRDLLRTVRKVQDIRP